MPEKTVSTTAKAFSIGGMLKKYWYWIVLIIIVAPAIIQSIQVAIQTDNPLYPFMLLRTKLLGADSLLQKQVHLLETNPSELIGMLKPDSGLWKTTLYYWKFFRNVIFEIMGTVWLIFFPFVVIYKITRLRDTSKVLPNLLRSLLFFFIYLFIINTIILVHGLIYGNSLVPQLQSGETFKEYLSVFIYLLPLHGLFALGKYLIGLAMIN